MNNVQPSPVSEQVSVSRKIYRFYGTALVVIAIAAVVAGVFYFVSLKDRYPKELVDITISPKWLNQAQFAGMFVAQEKGFYKKYGLNVNFKEFSFGSSPIEDLASGSSNLALMGANDFLVRYDTDNSIQAIAALYQISPFMMVSLRDKNITTPRAFRGKVIGMKGGPGAEGDLVVTMLLRAAGLSEDSVTKKDIGFEGSEKDDLLNGSADVVALYRTDQIYPFEKEGIHYNAIYPERYGSNMYNDVLVAKKDLIFTHPEIMRAFIRGTRDGWKYAFENIDEALAITLKYVTNDWYKDIDYERYIIEKSKPLIMPNGYEKIGAMDYERWERLYEALQIKDLIKSKYDVTDAVNTQFVN